MNARLVLVGSLLATAFIFLPSTGRAQQSSTTLGNPDIQYTVPDCGYHILQRGDITAVVVDNRAVNDDILLAHRAGYSGIASLKHAATGNNLFVPTFAGLNFEHIHDGTTRDRKILFEPRQAPMETRVINQHTVELYQAPTPNWKLESVLRYTMLEDGTIEMSFECIPRQTTFRHDYVGLFWASYIHQPESFDIHFLGTTQSSEAEPRWIRGITPSHGTLSTHIASTDRRVFPHDADFPLTLVFNRSNYVYTEPWYYGVSHGMAFIQMFRPEDTIRFSQSPSGGGKGNPAWDFQWLIDGYQVDRLYRMVMRAQFVPFESRKQIEQVSRPHRKALGIPVLAEEGQVK